MTAFEFHGRVLVSAGLFENRAGEGGMIAVLGPEIDFYRQFVAPRPHPGNSILRHDLLEIHESRQCVTSGIDDDLQTRVFVDADDITGFGDERISGVDPHVVAEEVCVRRVVVAHRQVDQTSHQHLNLLFEPGDEFVEVGASIRDGLGLAADALLQQLEVRETMQLELERAVAGAELRAVLRHPLEGRSEIPLCDGLPHLIKLGKQLTVNVLLGREM